MLVRSLCLLLVCVRQLAQLLLGRLLAPGETDHLDLLPIAIRLPVGVAGADLVADVHVQQAQCADDFGR
eukprot:133932-Pyramimonas_sp.AAC.1